MLHIEKKSIFVIAGAVFLGISSMQRASADVIDFDVFSYTGTVTVYNTLADAQNNTNGSAPYQIQTAANGTRTTLPNARDSYVYADTASNSFLFGTAWYFTPQEFLGSAYGYGNPNNTNTGFVQLYDMDGSSLSSLSMGWDPTRTQFSVSASGTNAGASEYARLWPAPTEGGAASISGGDFLSYQFDLAAHFSTPTPDGVRTGVTPDSVTGSFMGLFQNTGSEPSLNGYYLVSLALQGSSSAENNNYAAEYMGGTDFDSTAARLFVAPVPLPAAAPLLTSGLSLLGWLGWRRKHMAVAAA